MNESSEAYIEECEDYQFSDYDDRSSSSDFSSSSQSELDDEYFKITEKPIPVDELIRNTINPFIVEQWDSNPNSPSHLSTVENCQSDDYSYLEYLQRTFGDKPIEVSTDVVDLHSFRVVRRKKRSQKKTESAQTASNYFETNVYNWLVNKEDDDRDRDVQNEMGLQDQEIKLKNEDEENFKFKKEGRRKVKTSKKSLKKKKKNEMETIETTIDNNNNNKGVDETISDLGLKSNIMQTRTNSTNHVYTSTNKNHENSESSILHKKALLHPERDSSDLSWIINKKGLLKSIQSTNEETQKPRDTKNRKQQHYYDDNNLHSWRVNDSIMHSLSSIVTLINSYKTKPIKSMRKQKKFVNLPMKLQTKVFPILHRTPRIVCIENESLAAYYEQLFEDSMNNIVADTLTDFLKSLLGLHMPHLKDEVEHFARQKAAEGFGLLIQRKMSSVTLKYGVDNYGLLLIVETKDKLKYSKSRFRIICT